jgi:cytochrome c biogenesis protein CcmG, thiol:disulfide interchange protein DsbE
MRRFHRLALAMLLLPLALAARADGLQVGDRAPRVDTELASGKVLGAGHLEGKVVLQYFWATWCPICQGHLPRLEALYRAYQPRGFEIIAQSLDDGPSIVIDYWRDRGYTFPVTMRSDEIRAAYGPIRGTPTLFLIDRKGMVRLKRLGAMPDGTLEDEIKALLE